MKSWHQRAAIKRASVAHVRGVRLSYPEQAGLSGGLCNNAAVPMTGVEPVVRPSGQQQVSVGGFTRPHAPRADGRELESGGARFARLATQCGNLDLFAACEVEGVGVIAVTPGRWIELRGSPGGADAVTGDGGPERGIV